MPKGATSKRNNERKESKGRKTAKGKIAHLITPQDQCKQKTRSERDSRKRKSDLLERQGSKDRESKQSKITAEFVENDEVIYMEAEGQSTDFNSEIEDGEIDMEQSENGELNPESSDDEEIEFSNKIKSVVVVNSRNNNARIIPSAKDLEEGECSQTSGAPRSSLQSARGPNEEMELFFERKREMLQDSMNASLTNFQEYMDQKLAGFAKVMNLEKQLAENKKRLEDLKEKGMTSNESGNSLTINEHRNGGEDNRSEMTIYQNAVEREKRTSSSSEEAQGDTSDEFIQDHSDNTENAANVLMNHFLISERHLSGKEKRKSQYEEDHHSGRQLPPPPPLSKSAAEERIIKEAESAKARIADVPGRFKTTQNNLSYSAVIDKDYMLVASHLDSSLKEKIINHEYVDFSKLLKKEKWAQDEEQKMVMINKGGFSYWSPVADKSTAIHSYARWEQAFRVYLDVYTTRYPERANELIQYNHIINSTAQSYLWDNVYAYDREFRRHMERHPLRN